MKPYKSLFKIISENGPDIPDAIKDKIFQPFSKTKPTVQGTGLRLSLAYDIVKAHWGEIRVEPKEAHLFNLSDNEGAYPARQSKGLVFVVQLPV
jgi:signal transduction histidine kinase